MQLYNSQRDMSIFKLFFRGKLKIIERASSNNKGVKKVEVEWQRIVDKYTKKLFQLSYLYVKDFHAAEDIVQDVFLRFFEKQHDFRQKSSIETYLTRITINCSKDYLKSWRYRTHQVTTYFTGGYEMKNQLIASEERLEIAEAVLQLPIKYREIIILYFYKNHSFAEMSELLQLPISTIHYRYKKAQQKLKEKLSALEWEGLFHE